MGTCCFSTRSSAQAPVKPREARLWQRAIANESDFEETSSQLFFAPALHKRLVDLAVVSTSSQLAHFDKPGASASSLAFTKTKASRSTSNSDSFVIQGQDYCKSDGDGDDEDDGGKK